MPNQAAILTVGEKYVSGQAKDESGDLLAGILNKLGWEIAQRAMVGDDDAQISGQIIQWVDTGTIDAVFTLDGVGIQPKDRASEALYQVCEKWIPGIPEYVRAKLSEKTPGVILYRGLCGVRGKTLILNLPGTPIALKDTMDVLKTTIRLTVEQLKGV